MSLPPFPPTWNQIKETFYWEGENSKSRRPWIQETAQLFYSLPNLSTMPTLENGGALTQQFDIVVVVVVLSSIGD